jgi:hypothetical protein
MHSISVYLVNKSELRNEKIDSLKDVNKTTIRWVEMSSNILATTHIPDFKKWRKDKTVAKVETDYFGGAGSQSAKVFINGEKVLDQNSEFDWSLRPINSALKMLGVVKKDGLDEFDTIGLGEKRTNNDF